MSTTTQYPVSRRRRLLTGLVVGTLSFVSLGQVALADGPLDTLPGGDVITGVTDTVGLTDSGNPPAGDADGNLIDTDGVLDVDVSVGQPDESGSNQIGAPSAVDVNVEFNPDAQDDSLVGDVLDPVTNDNGLVDIDGDTTVDVTVGGDDNLVDVDADPDVDVTVGDDGQGNSIADVDLTGDVDANAGSDDSLVDVNADNIDGDVTVGGDSQGNSIADVDLTGDVDANAGSDDSLVDVNADNVDGDVTIGEQGDGSSIAEVPVTGNASATIGGDDSLADANLDTIESQPQVGSVNDALGSVDAVLQSNGLGLANQLLPGLESNNDNSLLNQNILEGDVLLDSGAIVGGENGLVEANAVSCIDATLLGSNLQQCDTPSQGDGGSAGTGDNLVNLDVLDNLTGNLVGENLLDLDNGLCLDLSVLGPGSGSSCTESAVPNPGDTPDNPGNGDNPDNPGSGDTPENPGNGDNPDNPGNGDTPDNPGSGDNPDNPGNGDNPGSDDNSDNPGNSDNSDNSGVNSGDPGLPQSGDSGSNGSEFSPANSGSSGTVTTLSLEGNANAGASNANATGINQLPLTGSGSDQQPISLTMLFLLLSALSLAAGAVLHRRQEERAVSGSTLTASTFSRSS